jgi:hypothetical protein
VTAANEPETVEQSTSRRALEFRRRQRGRNWAMMFALLVLAALFYAISVVRFKVH